MQGSFCNGWPILTITQDENKYDHTIEEHTSVSMDLDNRPFRLGMYNKSFGNNHRWDTKTDQSGNILEDKFIKFTDILIDDVKNVLAEFTMAASTPTSNIKFLSPDTSI